MACWRQSPQRRHESGESRQYTLEVPHDVADGETFVEPQLADRPLVPARPFLDDGDRLPDLAARFEVRSETTESAR
jgi:hypothetical protein